MRHLWYLVIFTIVFGNMYRVAADERDAMLLSHFMPHPPALTYSELRTGPVEVAKVFGRWPGCADADYELVINTSNEAVRAGLDPKIFAAAVAIESRCNQFAVSMRGAIGYTQVMPMVWNKRYDFTDKYNLFNQRDNLRVGASILADLIQQYGEVEGLHHYQGLGRECATCDLGYTDRILKLARK